MSITTTPGQVAGFLGQNYGPDAVLPLQYLTGFSITAAGGTFTSATFPQYNSLYIVIGITGFSGSDSAALRFNGDTGANYVARYITAAAGGTTLADAPFASSTSLRLSAAAGTTGLNAVIKMTNLAATSKQALINTHLTTGVAATAPTAVIAGSGEWVNTTAQITSVTLMCVGANNLNTGTSIMIFGGL